MQPDAFAALGSLAYKLHMELRNIYFLLLPIFFMVSVAIVWFQHPTGSPEFLDKIKRALIATLLLTAFSELTDAILFVANGIADHIDNMAGIDSVLQMASEKIHTYKTSSISPVLAFDDLVISGLSYLSWAVLYFARYVMVAIYNFAWLFLLILAPLLLLFHVFTSQITIKLFGYMAEIASWKIGWSVLSAMLKALPFGTWYAMDGNYFTLVILNFVIALAMASTPLIIHSLVSGSFTSMVGGLGGVTVTTMLGAPTKAIGALKFGSEHLGRAGNFIKDMHSKFDPGGDPPSYQGPQPTDNFFKDPHNPFWPQQTPLSQDPPPPPPPSK